MSTEASTLVQRVWSYANVLKDDGLAYLDYTEQITYLLFLKMIWEQRGQRDVIEVPKRYNWESLRNLDDNNELAKRYQATLSSLSKMKGLLALIFTRPQSKINDPAKLRRLIQLIDGQNWSALDVDVKGEVYEGLLAKNAEDVRGGAGQYFTPRPVIRAIVEVMEPKPWMTVADPACGTGGFLLATYDYLKKKPLKPDEQDFLKTKALHGSDIVASVARLCAMNLYLHGVGTDPTHPAISIGDSLEKEPSQVDMVLTNPPFGKKSSFTIVGNDGRKDPGQLSYKRESFWATTSNKQLNFIQHVYSMLKPGGRAAVVVPDNVLFEAGAGERIRQALIGTCDVHTLLRLPGGIWYSAGVQANVLFFDKPKGIKGRTKELWVYDLRTNMNFTLRHKPIDSSDLEDFIKCYSADNRKARRESERFKRFSIEELVAREKLNLDLTWLKRDVLVDYTNLPSPNTLAKSVLADLQSAIDEFAAAEKLLHR